MMWFSDTDGSSIPFQQENLLQRCGCTDRLRYLVLVKTAPVNLREVCYVVLPCWIFGESGGFGIRPSYTQATNYVYDIYIYGHPPPPWSTYKHFIWELPVFYAHFFLPEKWHSHVSISFTYYVSCRPRHTHTCNFVFVYFFVISWGFGQKPKNIEKTKKTKKTKIARPM